MSQPARDQDLGNNAQEELDAILREAMAMRNSAGPVDDLAAGNVPRKRPAPVLVEGGAGESTSARQADPSDTVKFDRFPIQVPQAGPNKLPAYRIKAQFPLIALLGAIAFGLWLFVPGGIQLLRPQPIPASR